MKLNNHKKVSFLISGSGSNLLKILKKNHINKDFKVITIISNNNISTKIKSYVGKFYKDVLIKEYQKTLQKKNFDNSDVIFSVGYMKVIEKIIIENFDVINLHPSVLPFYKGVLVKEYQRTLQKENFYNTDVIFSIGYMKVIEKSIIDNFDVINLHPSILPHYKGLMTQKRMLINNEKYYGFTIHKVSLELDDGQTISIKSRKLNTKNESELLKKHKSLEHQFVYDQFVDYLLN